MAVVSNEERNLNYDNFIDRLDIELQRAKRYERLLSLCIIAIDSKDEKLITKPLLKQFTQVVLEQARNVDISVTISPEEFCLILPETSFANGLQAAERIRHAISEHQFGSEEKPIKLTVSVGVSSFPDHTDDTAELARRAVQSVTAAQKQGGNCVKSAADL